MSTATTRIEASIVAVSIWIAATGVVTEVFDVRDPPCIVNVLWVVCCIMIGVIPCLEGRRKTENNDT